MLLTSILIFLGVSLLTNSYTIPDGFGDGVYGVHINGLGEEIHERLRDLLTEGSFAHPFSEIEARDIDPARGHHIYCGCGINLNHGNCDAAVAALKGQLNKNTLVYNAWYSI